MEPYRLKRWKSRIDPHLSFYTCARPGRSKGPNHSVPDAVVKKWIKGLPGAGALTIVSLLGRKPDGDSEFKFYTFQGLWDAEAGGRQRPSFQEWIAKVAPERAIAVSEFPTWDFRPIPPETLKAVGAEISRLLAEGQTVVLIDSGGETRTRRVCSYMGFVEAPGTS